MLLTSATSLRSHPEAARDELTRQVRFLGSSRPHQQVRQNREFLPFPTHLSDQALRPAKVCVRQLVALTARASSAEQDDLLVLRSFWRAQPISSLVLEVEGKNAPADGQSISGNNQHQHASGLEPAIAVLKKHLL